MLKVRVRLKNFFYHIRKSIQTVKVTTNQNNIYGLTLNDFVETFKKYAFQSQTQEVNTLISCFIKLTFNLILIKIVSKLGVWILILKNEYNWNQYTSISCINASVYWSVASLYNIISVIQFVIVKEWVKPCLS